MRRDKNTSFKLSEALFTVCRTTNERRQLIDELQFIEQQLYSTDKLDIKEIIDNNCRESTKEIVVEILGQDKVLFQQRINGFIETTKTLPQVKLTLAWEPTNQFILRLWQKVVSYTQGPVLLAIRFDPWLIGGAIITAKGKYGDYSLRGRIDHLLKEKTSYV